MIQVLAVYTMSIVEKSYSDKKFLDGTLLRKHKKKEFVQLKLEFMPDSK